MTRVFLLAAVIVFTVLSFVFGISRLVEDDITIMFLIWAFMGPVIWVFLGFVSVAEDLRNLLKAVEARDRSGEAEGREEA